MKIFVIKFTAFYLSCLLCFSLQKYFQLTPVMSSALIGFFGSFYWFSKEVEKSGVHAVIYAGSFAGMAAEKYLSGPGHIFFVSLLGTSLYLWSKPFLKGFGGKLGAIAFISTLILIVIEWKMA